jgi:hypothetical protein
MAPCHCGSRAFERVVALGSSRRIGDSNNQGDQEDMKVPLGNLVDNRENRMKSERIREHFDNQDAAASVAYWGTLVYLEGCLGTMVVAWRVHFPGCTAGWGRLNWLETSFCMSSLTGRCSLVRCW